jgi:3-phosphoglycerate kinase
VPTEEEDEEEKEEEDALISQNYFGNETLHVSDSFSVHHQEISTVHTAMVYVITGL